MSSFIWWCPLKGGGFLPLSSFLVVSPLEKIIITVIINWTNAPTELSFEGTCYLGQKNICSMDDQSCQMCQNCVIRNLFWYPIHQGCVQVIFVIFVIWSSGAFHSIQLSEKILVRTFNFKKMWLSTLAQKNIWPGGTCQMCQNCSLVILVWPLLLFIGNLVHSTSISYWWNLTLGKSLFCKNSCGRLLVDSTKENVV